MPRHIVSAESYTDDDIKHLLARTEFFKGGLKPVRPPLQGKRGLLLFYEPSTRTRLSFEAAILALGGTFSSTESAGQFSSAAKGETLEDTIRVASAYYDFIVLRHPENGAAERAAKVASVPVINAGDGSNEHPTQALLDVCTVWEAVKSGRLPKKLTILFAGDNLQSRAVRSFMFMLRRFAPTLGMEIKKVILADMGMSSKASRKLPRSDIVYITRLQRERYPEGDAALKAPLHTFTKAHAERLPKHAIIMHPLPRVDELADEVDEDPRAWYFKQAANGLYTRMALLEMLLSEE